MEELTHQIMKSKDHYQQEKTKKIGLMKDELGGKIMKEFLALIPNMYSYFPDKKKVKDTKKL